MHRSLLQIDCHMAHSSQQSTNHSGTIWKYKLFHHLSDTFNIIYIYILFRHLCDMPILQPCFHAYNREILRMGLALPILVANLQLECSLDDQRWASPMATWVLKMRQTTGLWFFNVFYYQIKKNRIPCTVNQKKHESIYRKPWSSAPYSIPVWTIPIVWSQICQ
jgi:hypothetical protein